MSLLNKRGGGSEEVERSGEVAALETARSAAESGADRGAEPKKDEEHISVFWRVFGGTILSIVALVSITLFNNMASSITELRTELSRGAMEDEVFNRKVVDRIPVGRWAEPGEIAGAAIFLASPAAAMVTGITLPVDGGYSAV